MNEFEDIQERLEGAIVRAAELLNKHGSHPCSPAEIASVVLAKEINYLTLSMNRNAMATEKVCESLKEVLRRD